MEHRGSPTGSKLSLLVLCTVLRRFLSHQGHSILLKILQRGGARIASCNPLDYVLFSPLFGLRAQAVTLRKQEKQFAQLVDDAIKRAIGKSKVGVV